MLIFFLSLMLMLSTLTFETLALKTVLTLTQGFIPYLIMQFGYLDDNSPENNFCLRLTTGTLTTKPEVIDRVKKMSCLSVERF